MGGLLGILAGVIQARATGEGTQLEVAQSDSALWVTMTGADGADRIVPILESLTLLSFVAGATERAFGSAARQNACAWPGDVKKSSS